MKSIINFIKNIFSYSHSEAKGFLALLIISLLALVALSLPKASFFHAKEIDPKEVAYLDSLANLFTEQQHELFSFNPNTLSRDSLELLGIPQNVARRIVNYREKGGVFRTKKDVGKIYGLDQDLLISISSYIDLPDSISLNKVSKKHQNFNINAASNIQLKQVPLIGDVLASRIMRYRDKLGGFIDEDQLAEVYGLTEEAITNLKSSVYVDHGFKPLLIKINQADLKALKSHPYISDQLAEDIVRYRKINSSIESQKVLSNFKSIDKANFETLILYLDFE